MRLPITLAFVFGAAALARAGDPLVVHEWGTFTSMQGSDGLSLEGLQREEERLPDFVYSRTKVRDCPLRRYGYKGLEVPATHVTQKMETPVLYFHTKTPRRVRVRVDFPNGLLTQWYPVCDRLGPPEGERTDGPLDLSTVKGSFLEWDVEVAAEEQSPAFPAVSPDDPWRFAREVDAARLRTVPRRLPERMGPTEAERFLFYRGLGTFHLPLETRTRAGGVVELRNGGDERLPAVIAMQVANGEGRFVVLGGLDAAASKTAELASAASKPLDAFAADLRSVVARALVEQGLFEDEAQAMVRTWSRSWFTSEGTRLLYVVPRATTDALLPLDIAPKPDAIVRVLVGRLECLTPEVESEVEAALRDRASRDPVDSERALVRLARFDRFLEPMVRAVLARTTDAAVRQSGEALLASLK